jgi:hypothetical protein
MVEIFHLTCGWGRVVHKKMSRKNFDPKVWGPPAWRFIEFVVASYPDEVTEYDQGWMTEFLVAIAEALPCESCRDNYATWMSLKPLDGYIGTRESVTEWLAGYKVWARSK